MHFDVKNARLMVDRALGMQYDVVKSLTRSSNHDATSSESRWCCEPMMGVMVNGSRRGNLNDSRVSRVLPLSGNGMIVPDRAPFGWNMRWHHDTFVLCMILHAADFFYCPDSQPKKKEDMS